jgi:hypothetical protein
MTDDGRRTTNPAFSASATAYWLFLLCALITAWAFRYPPMDDFPDWLYQGSVLAGIIRHQPEPGFRLMPVPVPHSAGTVVIGLLNLVVPLRVAGALFVSLCIVAYVLAARYLVTASDSSPGFLLFVPLLYLFCRNYWTGELDYVLGVALFFFGVGYLLRNLRTRSQPSVWLLIALSVAIFFSHVIPYYCWLLVLALLLILYQRPTTDARRPTHLGTRLRIAIGATPSLILMAIYAVSFFRKGGNAHQSITIAHWVRSKLVMLGNLFILQFFDPFYRSEPRLVTRAAAVVNVLVCLVVLALIWYWLKGRLRSARSPEDPVVSRFLLVAPLLLAVVAIFAPFEQVTGSYDISERFVYPAFGLLVAGLACGASNVERRTSNVGGGRSLPRAVGGGVAALLTIQMGFTFYEMNRCERRLANVYNVLKTCRLDSDYWLLREHYFNFEGQYNAEHLRPLLLTYRNPLTHFADYLSIEGVGRTTILGVGMLLEDDVPKSPDSISDLRQKWNYPGQVVLLGSAEGDSIMAGLLSDRYAVIRKSDYVTILQRIEASRIPR